MRYFTCTDPEGIALPEHGVILRGGIYTPALTPELCDYLASRPDLFPEGSPPDETPPAAPADPPESAPAQEPAPGDA